MSLEKLEQMKRDCLGLSEAERLDLTKFLQAFIAVTADKGPLYRSKGGRLYEQVTKELGRRYPAMKFVPLKNIPKIAAKYEDMASVLEFQLKSAIQHPTHLKAADLLNRYFRLFATIMIDWLQEIPNVPVGVATIITNGSKFPSLLDRQFPGYGHGAGLILILSR